MDMIDFGLGLVYGMIALALLLLVVFFVWQAIQDPMAMIKPVIGVVGLVILFFISLGISSGDIIYSAKGEAISDAATSQWAGGGIIMVYILLIMAGGAFVFGWVRSFIK